MPQRPPVFEIRPYEEAVLELPSSLTEHEIEERCYNDAKREGLCPQPLTPLPTDTLVDRRASFTSFTPSSTTVSTNSLRSHSIDSRASSFATDVRSSISATSSDRRRTHLFSLPLRSLSRLSSRDPGLGIDIPTPLPTERLASILAPSAFLSSPRSLISTSDVSSSSSSSRRSFSVRRGFGRFSRPKRSSRDSGSERSSSPCSQCRSGSHYGQRPAHSESNNTVSYEQFLRNLANADTPMRRSLAAGREPQSYYKDQSNFAQRRTSIRFDDPLPPSRRGQHDEGIPALPKGESKSADLAGVVEGSAGEAESNLAEAMTCSSFQKLREDQMNAIKRFAQFRTMQRATLTEFHSSVRKERIEQHKAQLEDLRETHAQALFKLEEQQLLAELDLHEVHEQEKSNCSLALRHMKGYVQSGRALTQQDLRELDKQYWLRDNMQHRNESAINVLREQQQRQLRFRAKDQETEFEALELWQKHDIEELDAALKAEMQDLNDLFLRRRIRLAARWSLADELWRRENNERSDNVKIIGYPIAPQDWPLEITLDR